MIHKHPFSVTPSSRVAIDRNGDGPTNLLCPKTFQEITIEGKPWFALNNLNSDGSVSQPIDFGQADGSGGDYAAIPLVLTIPKGMRRTASLLAQAGLQTYDMTTIPNDDHVDAYSINVLDRLERLPENSEPDSMRKDPTQISVDHFCIEGSRDDLERACAMGPFKCMRAVMAGSAEDYRYVSCKFDLKSMLDAAALDATKGKYPNPEYVALQELNEQLQADASEGVDMVAMYLPNRTVVWAPLPTIDARKDAHYKLDARTNGTETVFAATDTIYLDGPDIFMTYPFRLDRCEEAVARAGLSAV